MRNRLAVIFLGLGLAASPLASADIIGAGASVSYWNAALNGTAAQGRDQIDIENQLDLGRSGNLQFSASLEHPLPLLPNIRIGFTRLEQDGSSQLGASFGDLRIGGAVAVESEFELDQLDLTLYYELLDNWVNLDAGLTVRSVDGALLIQERGNRANSNRTDVDVYLPMVYLAARFDVPGTSVSFGADGNGVRYSGEAVMDITAYAQYDIAVLRLQAGYRQLSIDVEDGNDSLDVDIDGPFVSVGLDF